MTQKSNNLKPLDLRNNNFSNTLDDLFKANNNEPITVGVSACLLGVACNYKSENNLSDLVNKLKEYPKKIKIIEFCPEESVLGTPREPMNIHFGDGLDVLDGKAKILTHSGTDITETMIKGARKFLEILKINNVRIALLKEGSPSCASNFIFKGEVWPEKEFTPGLGITAALLERNNISVISELNKEDINKLLSALG